MTNIGTVAERCGLAAKTIRYSAEEVGLIHPAERRAIGYRSYSSVDVRELMLIQRAQPRLRGRGGARAPRSVAR